MNPAPDGSSNVGAEELDAGEWTAHCHVCEMRNRSTPQDLIYQDDLWTATVAQDAPGWIMVQANRHGEDWLWGLTSSEAGSLGPLLKRLTRALKEVSNANRVYLQALGENSLHFHALLIPRLPDTPADWRGPTLIHHINDLADPTGCRLTAGRLRDALAGGQEDT